MEIKRLSVKEFSEKTGLPVKVVRRLIKEKRIVFIYANRRYYIDYLSSLEKLFNGYMQVYNLFIICYYTKNERIVMTMTKEQLIEYHNYLKITAINDNSQSIDEMLDEAEQAYQEGMYISADVVLDLLRSEQSFQL